MSYEPISIEPGTAPRGSEALQGWRVRAVPSGGLKLSRGALGAGRGEDTDPGES